ncbi:Hypothetical protein AA314_01773 [Archangium gephyra]|uniref:Uncharacterized protein n=1 Tax=Archangium gephyra TaxID=48 RepID=A0AAC8TBW3_9BACT|nr:Hypothetical protein AA314_01773 [Archangium gephyra]
MGAWANAPGDGPHVCQCTVPTGGPCAGAQPGGVTRETAGLRVNRGCYGRPLSAG